MEAATCGEDAAQMAPAVLVRIPAHCEPGGFICFQRRGEPVRPGLATCTCCGARVILPYSWSPLSPPIELSPTQ